MPGNKPLIRIAISVAVMGVLLLAGGAAGVGPFAAITPPDKVTDPKEMIARSLQATLDATSVHLEASLAGHAPGAAFDRPEASVTLDGTTVAGDIRSHDAKTRAHLVVPALGVNLDTVTVWDSAYYRTTDGGSWTKASVGGASAQAGVDINPLTLVDRLRSYLDTPGFTPTVRDVACASASGQCHEVRLETGTDPARIVAQMLPGAHGTGVAGSSAVITLQTDVKTLRPAHLDVTVTNPDGSLSLHLVVDASGWDQDVTIAEPSAG